MKMKIKRELGWRPRETFASGLRRTMEWYLANSAWITAVQDQGHKSWMEKNYNQRSCLSNF